MKSSRKVPNPLKITSLKALKISILLLLLLSVHPFLSPTPIRAPLYLLSTSTSSTPSDPPPVVWTEVFARDLPYIHGVAKGPSFHPSPSLNDDSCDSLEEVECKELDPLGKLSRRLAQGIKKNSQDLDKPGFAYRGYWREARERETGDRKGGGGSSVQEGDKIGQDGSETYWVGRGRLKNVATTGVGVRNFYSYVTSIKDLEYMEGLVEMGLGVVGKMGEDNMGAGEEVLRRMKRRVSKKSAFDTLVLLNVWSPHESTPLLLLPYPLHPNQELLNAASSICGTPPPDVDSDLGIRRDLRRSKCYTIDGGGSEIDDAVGVEVFKGDDGRIRRRYWVHIADVERWVFGVDHPSVLEYAMVRGTSVYMPTGSIGMFPGGMQERMSLLSVRDTPALSMSLEVDEGGGVLEDSIEVMPSTIRVDYKLTYDEVDEMLSEGVGYREEWELGVMLQLAKARRAYRIGRNATER